MRLLDGVIVLDLTQAYSGPFCTMNLADHGATVIKIERPPVGDQTRTWVPMKNGASAYYALINRNKKSLSLDLRTEKGKDVFRKLVEKADVVCENFRPGTMEKLGLGYDDLRPLNPRLIYASISGFGLTGPLSSRPAYDIVAQGMSGMMSITGFPDSPPTKIGPSIGDSFTGAYLMQGVLMGLYNREKTGQGHRLDVAMMDTLFSVLENAVVTYTVEGVIPGRVGNIDPATAPFDTFEASDGTFVLGAATDKMWQKLCNLMGKPELITDQRFLTTELRCKHYNPDMKELIEAWTTTKTIDEMEEILVEAGIPFGRVLNVAEATEHPQTRARNMIQEVESPGLGKARICGIPVKVRGVSDNIEKGAPALGEHNDEILQSLLGMTGQAIAELRADGAIYV